MGNGFFTRGLDRLLGQLVAELAFAPAFVELDIFEMTQVTASFAYLEFLLIGFVLVAGDTGNLLTFDLFFFVEVRFVNKNDFLGELDFLGFKFVIRLTVTDGCHTAGIDNLWSRPNGIAAQGQVGKMTRWFGRDVTGVGYAFSCRIWHSVR